MYKALDAIGCDIELVQSGALKIATSASQERDLRSIYRTQSANGYDVEFIAGAEQVRRIEPNLSSKVRCAIRTQQSGHIDPGKATVAVAEQAQEHGAVIYEDMAVRSIERISMGLRVRTECGRTIECAHVIIASGTHCGYLGNADGYGLGISIPVVPVKVRHAVLALVSRFVRL